MVEHKFMHEAEPVSLMHQKLNLYENLYDCIKLFFLTFSFPGQRCYNNSEFNQKVKDWNNDA